jgi:hypothetical protein
MLKQTTIKRNTGQQPNRIGEKTMTLEQAKQLVCGDIVHHKTAKNADDTPQRFRVNGKPKIWKTRPNEVQVPVKRGMYEFGYLTEHNIAEFELGRGS